MPSTCSQFLLEIQLPVDTGQLVFRTREGEFWTHSIEPLDKALCTATLWQRMTQEWDRRQDLLTKAGAELGRWLFDERAARFLASRLPSAETSAAPLRIALRVPQSLAEYPWEIASLESTGPLGVHPAVTLIRVSNSGQQTESATISGQLFVHVIGVEYVPQREDDWPPLTSAEEVEVVRQAIEGASVSPRFVVQTDVRGDWHALVESYRKIGPPHVLHFAGHGLPDGRGLVFQDQYGRPKEIYTAQIVNLLVEHVHGRHTRLTFLNACHSSADGKGAAQPFGGLAAQLIAQQIPMVVGLQTPVDDSEAKALAGEFYAALASGDTVDCAIQKARRALFLHGGRGAGWAFLSLHVSGEPASLCVPSGNRDQKPSATIMSFGHEDQRQRLERFLRRRDPLVVFVHGVQGAGHRHVLTRLRFDMEQAGLVLWKPVAEMQWYTVGEPQLMRSLLAGEIARALAIADTGSLEDLEARLASTIADRCANNSVMVIDLVDVLILHSQEWANALTTLILHLWSDVMEKAGHYRTELPVFLLVSVAYPRPLPAADPQARRIEEIRQRTEDVVTSLESNRRLSGRVRIETLPRLEQINQMYVAEFLEDTLDLDRKEADSIAVNLTGDGIHDNETILAGMARELARREEI